MYEDRVVEPLSKYFLLIYFLKVVNKIKTIKET